MSSRDLRGVTDLLIAQKADGKNPDDMGEMCECLCEPYERTARKTSYGTRNISDSSNNPKRDI